MGLEGSRENSPGFDLAKHVDQLKKDFATSHEGKVIATSEIVKAARSIEGLTIEQADEVARGFIHHIQVEAGHGNPETDSEV